MNASHFSGISLAAPVAVIAILVLLACHFTDKWNSFYRFEIDKELRGDRFHSIDGIRGFLAYVVLMHHAAIIFFYYVTGRWELPQSRLAIFFGQGGVALFFMITAFLFWHRGLVSNGNMDLRRFFWSRITRLSPMFFIMAALLIITTLTITKFQINDPLQTLKESAAWLAFGFQGSPPINGFNKTGVINGVFWSLAYEWRFYLALPILLLFARGKYTVFSFLMVGILIGCYTTSGSEWYFLYGALAAEITFRFGKSLQFCKSGTASLICLALLATVPLITSDSWAPYIAPIYLVPFIIIANGNSLFGILKLRAARLFGMVTYSFYLIHCFVLFLTFQAIEKFISVASISYLQFWSAVAGVALTTLGISLWTYRYVEYRFMKMKLPSNASVQNKDLEPFGEINAKRPQL